MAIFVRTTITTGDTTITFSSTTLSSGAGNYAIESVWWTVYNLFEAQGDVFFPDYFSADYEFDYTGYRSSGATATSESYDYPSIDETIVTVKSTGTAYVTFNYVNTYVPPDPDTLSINTYYKDNDGRNQYYGGASYQLGNDSYSISEIYDYADADGLIPNADFEKTEYVDYTSYYTKYSYTEPSIDYSHYVYADEDDPALVFFYYGVLKSVIFTNYVYNHETGKYEVQSGSVAIVVDSQSTYSVKSLVNIAINKRGFTFPPDANFDYTKINDYGGRTSTHYTYPTEDTVTVRARPEGTTNIGFYFTYPQANDKARIYHNGKWVKAKTYVYHNGIWEVAEPNIHTNNSWE